MLDLRTASNLERVFPILRSTVLILVLGVLGFTGILTFAPEEPKEKVVTREKIVKVKVPQVKVREREVKVRVATPPEPQIKDGIGTMSAREFIYITRGMNAQHLDDMFGRPPGNVEADGKSFYPAASGGKYWVFFKSTNCENIDEEEICDQKVASKRYEP